MLIFLKITTFFLSPTTLKADAHVACVAHGSDEKAYWCQWCCFILIWPIIYRNKKDEYRNIQSTTINSGSFHACKCSCSCRIWRGCHLSNSLWSEMMEEEREKRFVMRQKNSDGAEVMWKDPEEGHIQRPPSGSHRSVCSCSPGKLCLLVEIHGQCWGRSPPACTDSTFSSAQHRPFNLLWQHQHSPQGHLNNKNKKLRLSVQL